jgi:hypothetical protein
MPGLAVLLGAIMLLNGIVMLLAPLDWYLNVPGVTRTGPFNQHFIRDIGMIYMLIGVAFLAGAFRPSMSVMAWGTASLWLTAHALFHFWEVAAGICGPSVLLVDFPAVTVPAIVGIGLTWWASRSKAARSRLS